MQNDKKKVSALILAAGNSIRMGKPKFMLDFDPKSTFLEKIVEGYKKFGCKEVVVVLNIKGTEILKKTNSRIIEFVKIVVNSYPEKERFLSIKLGLKALEKPEMVFIHPVDNPFVDCNVLQLLLENSNRGDYQIPTYLKKGGHPILISGKIIRSCLFTGNTNQNFKNFLKDFIASNVNLNESKVLSNINTPADYIEYLQNLSNQ